MRDNYSQFDIIHKSVSQILCYIYTHSIVISFCYFSDFASLAANNYYFHY